MAVLAMCALATSSADASSFHATEMGSLKATARATQVFKTSAGSVECSTIRLTAGEALLNSAIQTAEVQYENCKAFGLTATITPAIYAFSSLGSVKLLNTLTIEAPACKVTVFSTKNQSLSTIKYKNSSKEVWFEPSITGITSSGTGAGCTYAEENKGTYTGNSSIGMGSGLGTVEWRATGGGGGGEAEEEANFGWLEFVNHEQTFKITAGGTVNAELRYVGGPLTKSGNLTVFVTNEFEDAASPCNGKSLAVGAACEVKIKCNGAAGKKGEVLVKSRNLIVLMETKKLECV